MSVMSSRFRPLVLAGLIARRRRSAR